MKNLKNLGKVLGKKEQKRVMGGFNCTSNSSCGTGYCCGNNGYCYPNPNHYRNSYAVCPQPAVRM